MESTPSAHRHKKGRSSISNGTRLFSTLDGLDGRCQTLRRFRDLVESISLDLGGIDYLSDLEKQLAAFSIPERIWLRDHRSEIEGMIAETKKEKAAGRFMLKPAEEKAAQDFTTKMEKAGLAIENSFVKGLVRLAAPLGEL